MPRAEKARFYLRDIDRDVWKQFRILAIKHGLSINKLMLAIIKQAVDFGQEQEKTAANKSV